MSTCDSETFQTMLNWNKNIYTYPKTYSKNKFEVAIWRRFPIVTQSIQHF